MSRTQHAPICKICNCYSTYTSGSIIIKKLTSSVEFFLSRLRKPLCEQHANEKHIAEIVLKICCVNEIYSGSLNKERKNDFPKKLIFYHKSLLNSISWKYIQFKTEGLKNYKKTVTFYSWMFYIVNGMTLYTIWTLILKSLKTETFSPPDIS